MDKNRLKYFIENKKKFKLYWEQPWPALNEQDKQTSFYIQMSATVEDCINFSRHVLRKMDKEHLDMILNNMSEADILNEFILTYKAHQGLE